MSADFQNKVVLITGGSTGIGRATAFAVAKQGAKVVVADINQFAAEQVVQTLQEQGLSAMYIKVDVSKAQDVEKMVNQTVAQFGGLDIAINNAGIEGDITLIGDYSEEMFDRVMNINVKGVWLSMKYQIPALLKRGGGTIVNIASVAGILGVFQGGPYSASKHAVIGLTKSAALEYIRANIRVNAVLPSFIKTPMVERSFKEHPQRLERFTMLNPTKRLGEAEEVVSAILWLASASSSYVNGHSLVVDGGLSIQ